MSSKLFQTLRIREVEFRNRIFVSPMCQYSAKNGVPGEWHFVHYGSRASGGAGGVIFEATAVSPEGRISYGDLGLWNEEQESAFSRITAFVKSQGAVAGIQLAHAGRKGSCEVPWRGGQAILEGANSWPVLAPSALAFAPGSPEPRELSRAEIARVVDDFAAAAGRALRAGFELLEIHMAHGYLLHEFLSPLSNRRSDLYGGQLENRLRLPLEVVRRVRAVWPQHLPLFVRVSATDWVEGGWDLPQTLVLSRYLKEIGVDLLDCSSGGLVADAKIPAGPNFQVPFAEVVRKEAGLLTGAVGLITEPQQAEEIVASGKADAVLIGRGFLKDPHWALHCASALGVKVPWPPQYERAK
jgi:2,4-dienoyl-CoA reductase-like NADH-dependent reductase (Old Yellow Enzyme family)